MFGYFYVNTVPVNESLHLGNYCELGNLSKERERERVVLGVFLVGGVELLDAEERRELVWWLGTALACGVASGSGYWEGLGWV